MANPLARVVMTNLVDVGKGKQSKSSRENYSNSSTDINLSPKEESLLIDLIGGGASNLSGGRSSVAKGYKSNSGSPVSGLKTIDSLAGNLGKASSSSSTSYGEKVSYGQKSNNYGQKSEYGAKAAYSSSSVKSGAGVKAVSLNQLAGNSDGGEASYVSAPAKTAIQQGTKSSGMKTLDQLADEKGHNKNKSEKKSSSSNVKSSVIGNLEGYIPKVSLNSIGKSSLF